MTRLLSNTLARILAAQDEDEIEKDWKEIRFDDLYVIEKQGETKIEEDIRKHNLNNQIQILKAIDSRTLWQAEVVGNVAAYLKKLVKRYIKFIKEALEEGGDWKLNTSDADDSWKIFKKADLGVSNTIAKRTLKSVNGILEEKKTGFHDGMPFDIYQKVIKQLGELAGNNYVWYGQSEAQQILNE